MSKPLLFSILVQNMADSESEEEILVVVEFNQSLPPPVDGNKFKVIGLDSDKPIVQYQKQVFRGEWSDVVGTKVLFHESAIPEAKDPVFSTETPKFYDYSDKTSKVLKLHPYVLSQADESLDSSSARPDENSDDEEEHEFEGKSVKMETS